MSQFIANVKAHLVDDELQALRKLKDQTVNVKVNLTGDGASFVKSFNSQLSSLANTSAQAGAKIGKNISNGAKNAVKSLDDIGNRVSKVETILDGFNKSGDKFRYATGYQKLEEDVRGALTVVEKLNDAIKRGDNSNFDSLITDLKQVENTASKAQKEIEKLKQPISSIEAMRASNETKAYVSSNSKMQIVDKDLYDSMNLTATRQAVATTRGELESLNKEVRAYKSIAKSKGATGNSFAAEFSRAAKSIFEFTQIYGGIERVINSIEEGVSRLKEANDIITEISKVSSLSQTQIKQLEKDAYGYASEYGKTMTSYLQGVTEMYRSGFDGQQGVDLANTSVLAQAAGDMTADVANAYLLATNAAYEYAGSAEKLNAVLDGQNMITNRNSVNMTDMAEATTQAGSMAAQAGVEVNQLSALIGTAVARTKKSGNEVGTALKALFINLQNTQNDKITGTFDSLGISMTKMVGNTEMLKTPIELLKELSAVYNTLPDGAIEKSEILTNIGGKHHANILSALLSGYSDYEKMITDYSEGFGSAAREAEKSANNWSGTINKLQNSWTQLIGQFASSDTVIGSVNVINLLVQAINGLVDAATPLGTIGIGAGIFSFVKNFDKPKIHRVSPKIFSYI